MNRLTIPAALVLATLSLLCLSCARTPDPAGPAGEHYHPEFRRLMREVQHQARLDPQGNLRPDLWLAGMQKMKEFNEQGPQVLRDIPPLLMSWQQVGPQPLAADWRVGSRRGRRHPGPFSGEVTGIAIDPRGTSDTTIHIATGHGGVWKTTDGGRNWSPKTDALPSLTIGAIALDPVNPDIVYAGTGNPVNSLGVYGLPRWDAIGLYRSTDAGDTWAQLPPRVFDTQPIWRMAAPAGGVLLVAAGGGLFRSIDGGLNFGTNAPLFNNGLPVIPGVFLPDVSRLAQATDVAVDTASSQIVYAAVERAGLFMSLDGGRTFPVNLFGNPGAPAPGTFGYIAFAQSTLPNNQTLYASVATAGGTWNGLYRSRDRGMTWTRMPGADPAAAGCQCVYDQIVGVDPRDADHVYLGFQAIWRSSDGGVAFRDARTDRIHVDMHFIAFSPRAHWPRSGPTPLYLGSDGGIFLTRNAGDRWTSLNKTLATTLQMAVAVGRSDPAYRYSPAWDNGLPYHRASHRAREWHHNVTGDGGGTVAVDPTDARIAYSVTDGNYWRTKNGGKDWAGPPPTLATLSGGAVFRVLVDPVDGQFVYATSGFNLIRSTDGGLSFENMARFDFDGTGDFIWYISIQPRDPNVMLVSMGMGRIWRTSSARSGIGAAWEDLGMPGGARKADVAVHPTNPNMAAAVFDGFSAAGGGVPSQHVFLLTGSSGSWAWTDISGNPAATTNIVPDLPVYSVVWTSPLAAGEPNALLIANEGGVLISRDLGITWRALAPGLPLVSCVDLDLTVGTVLIPGNPPTETLGQILTVATHGRSCWQIGLPRPIIPGDRPERARPLPRRFARPRD